jgi:hypothetical protein
VCYPPLNQYNTYNQIPIFDQDGQITCFVLTTGYGMLIGSLHGNDVYGVYQNKIGEIDENGLLYFRNFNDDGESDESDESDEEDVDESVKKNANDDYLTKEYQEALEAFEKDTLEKKMLKIVDQIITDADLSSSVPSVSPVDVSKEPKEPKEPKVYDLLLDKKELNTVFQLLENSLERNTKGGKFYSFFQVKGENPRFSFLTDSKSGFFTQNHPLVTRILELPSKYGYRLLKDTFREHVYLFKLDDSIPSIKIKDKSYNCVPLDEYIGSPKRDVRVTIG